MDSWKASKEVIAVGLHGQVRKRRNNIGIGETVPFATSPWKVANSSSRATLYASGYERYALLRSRFAFGFRRERSSVVSCLKGDWLLAPQFQWK